jgi:hypothetical protein
VVFDRGDRTVKLIQSHQDPWTARHEARGPCDTVGLPKCTALYTLDTGSDGERLRFHKSGAIDSSFVSDGLDLDFNSLATAEEIRAFTEVGASNPF